MVFDFNHKFAISQSSFESFGAKDEPAGIRSVRIWVAATIYVLMKDIYPILALLQIAYIRHDHPAVFTCEEADRYYQNIKGGKSKNLLLRNRKGDRHYLVIVESFKQVDLKKLTQQLGEAKLGFASPERLMKYLGLTPGSVSPFGLINDETKNVTVVIDQDLWKYDRLHYHPNINTATLELAREDFKKFLEWCGNEVRFLEIA